VTAKKLLTLSFVFWLLLALLKVWFFNYVIFTNPGVQEIVFWVLVAILAAAMSRRFGIIHFVEAGVIIGVWCVTTVLVDLIITRAFTGTHIFSTAAYWYSYLMIGLSVLFFHKKRHIHLRKELAKHHGHH